MPVHSLDHLHPVLPPEGQFWIAPSATVIGEVTLEPDVGIWFGAVLRGDNAPIVIGARSNIQEHAMIHADPGFPVQVGADVTIGHRAIIHGCTIGDGSLIGMGAIVLNGAVIGKGCLIGAGALVREGQIVPDGSLLVGSPGRVIRELDEEARADLLLSAADYVENWRRFASGLGPNRG